MTDSSTSPGSLEAALTAAQARRDRATAGLADGRASIRDAIAADDEVAQAERALAAARGQAYAEPVALPVRWCMGAPLPTLLADDYRTLLLFVIADDPDPDWDGRSVRPVGPETEGRIASVEFVDCASAKLGMPNDEAFHGHPLYGSGLRGYGAYRVVNSPWIREMAAINSVHHSDSPASWTELSHFIFGFHDSTFECVARDFSVATFQGSIASVLAAAGQRF